MCVCVLFIVINLGLDIVINLGHEVCYRGHQPVTCSCLTTKQFWERIQAQCNFSMTQNKAFVVGSDDSIPDTLTVC